MSLLNPLFLMAGLLVAVPIFLHLFHKHETRRLAFPALRYLRRTEKEHARRIRFRQLLLLVLRSLALLLLALAGARPFLTGPGSAHPPTALAIVLDNSMSSGLVVADEQVLDGLKRIALSSIDQSSDRDRIWVLRAGDPGDVSVPSTREQARARVQETAVSEGHGDLDAALERARTVVASSELPQREVHLISDLQRGAFSVDPPTAPTAGVPVVVFVPPEPPPPNGSVTEVIVSGGLPPVANQPTQVAARLAAASDRADDTVAVRLLIDGNVRGATVAPRGSTVLFPAGVAASGEVSGYVETDPDALRADDRRYFSYRVRPPPLVAVAGVPSPFVVEALQVLADEGRIRLVGEGSPAEALVTTGGGGLTASGPPVMVVAPASDPALLPALNRGLAAAGIPWSFQGPLLDGEVRVTGSTLDHDVSDLRVLQRFALVPDSPPDPANSPPGIQVGVGEPWLVTGADGPRSYLIVGSPLELEATSLPVSAVMVPLFEWAFGRSAGGLRLRSARVGEPLPVPEGATAVAAPDGMLLPVTPGQPGPRPRLAGLYRIVAGDSTLATAAVNVPLEESDLSRIPTSALRSRLGPGVRVVSSPSDWSRSIFQTRQGPEVWRPLLLVVLAILVLESVVAASGRRESERPLGSVAEPA